MKMNNNIREKIDNINNKIKNENKMKELIKPNNQLNKNTQIKEKENENKKIKDNNQNKKEAETEAEKVINNSNNNKNLNMNKDTNLTTISKIKENLNKKTLGLKKNKSQKIILKDNQSKININSIHKRVKSYEKF